MLRGSKVGDVVALTPIGGREITGTITGIDRQGVRCVATMKGLFYATPGEMSATDEPDRTKAIEDLEPGDRVTLFNGSHRIVDHVATLDPSSRCRVTFVEQGGATFRQAVGARGDRYYVITAPLDPSGD